MKEGTKVKLIGVVDRDDKQVYGRIISYDPEGLAIVETKDRVCGIVSSRVEKV